MKKSKGGSRKKAEQFEEYIWRVAKQALCIIYQSYFQLDIHFQEEECKDDGPDGIKTFANVKVSSVYLYATIDVFPVLRQHFDAKAFQSVGQKVLHEIAHIITDPMAREMMNDCAPSMERHYTEIVERQTELVAKIMEHGMVLVCATWYLPGVKK